MAILVGFLHAEKGNGLWFLWAGLSLHGARGRRALAAPAPAAKHAELIVEANTVALFGLPTHSKCLKA